MSDERFGLVDYHCHLDLYPNYIEEFKACEQNRLTVLTVTTTPRAWRRNCELAAGSKFIRAGLGLHPQLVGQHGDDEELFSRYFEQSRFIGEVGLDASAHYFKHFDEQVRIFENILERCARAGDKILSVHSVRAAGEVLKRLEKFLPTGSSTAVLHWFGGNRQDVARAVRLGCYFSVNQEMLAKDSRRQVVSSIPLDRLLTETDGPFIRVQPGNVFSAIKELATLYSISEDAIKKQIQNNVDALERSRH
jgi:TatD DNase family protein